QRLDAPYLVLEVDRKKASRVGLSASDVILQVVAAMNSSVSINRNFWIDAESGNQYFVAVQYQEDPDRKLEDILTGVHATGTKNPNPVLLSSLIVYPPRQTRAAVEVNHVSLEGVFNVLVNTENRDIGSLAAHIEEVLKELPKPKGVKVELKGEYAP